MNNEQFTAIKAKPCLSQSQLSFRIGLARERTQKYPMDDMNFILMDLERPEQSSRHAHWCAGDLTGRTLEFLSTADGVDGVTDERLPEMFNRILNTQRLRCDTNTAFTVRRKPPNLTRDKLIGVYSN